MRYSELLYFWNYFNELDDESIKQHHTLSTTTHATAHTVRCLTGVSRCVRVCWVECSHSGRIDPLEFFSFLNEPRTRLLNYIIPIICQPTSHNTFITLFYQPTVPRAY